MEKTNAVKAFLMKKDAMPSLRRYGIDAMAAMAQGLFCTLLLGTILNTLGHQLGIGFLNREWAVIAGKGYTIGAIACAMAGPAMAVAIGSALKAPGMVLFSLVPVGYATNALGGAGGPFAVYVVAILAAEAGKLVSKETRVDILVTPLVTLMTGLLMAGWIAAPIGAGASSLGRIIMWGTQLQPFLMGILVAVTVGIALTLPISSAAICAGLGLTGLAGGAALAGCCAQMVGFATMSFRENRWGGLVSQGIGTSMLQMGNIVRNPRIALPPILTSVITGPLATCLFHLEMNGEAVNSGMGTCGLCGPIGVWTGWVEPSASALSAGAQAIAPGAFEWTSLLLVSIILPAILCPLIALPLRKIGWIRPGDMKL